MHQQHLTLVSAIIKKSSRERPADAVLRQELRGSKGLLRNEGFYISRAVFSYFRWREWLERKAPLDQQIAQALELADEFKAKPATFSDTELAERAIPAWLADHVTLKRDEAGNPIALGRWARAIQSEPRLWLRARKGQGQSLAAQLGYCEQPIEGLPDVLEYCGLEDLFRTPEFQAGAFEVQDIGSQAVGLICGAKAGETWWDACAGEGGKLLHLSDLMDNRGLIWATDRTAWRLKKLQLRAGRARVFNYRAKAWEGGTKLPFKTRFDGILLDAPCSGLGTWQRNPHARWTTEPSDVAELSVIQKNLLAHVAGGVKPGGKLVYAVCTLTDSETVKVGEDFDKNFPEFTRCEITDPISPSSKPVRELMLRTEVTGGNGMFIAAWKRRPA